MLVQLREVEKFLADAGAIVARARLPGLRLVYASEVRDLLLRRRQLCLQMLNTVVILLFRASVNALEAAVLAAEDDHWTLVLVLEQLIVQ
jgi:hypothetical protein